MQRRALNRRTPKLHYNRHRMCERWQAVHEVGTQGASRVHTGGDSDTCFHGRDVGRDSRLSGRAENIQAVITCTS
jgi:hypothetical protein